MGYDEFYKTFFGHRDQLTAEGQAWFDERYYARAQVPMHLFVFSVFLGQLGVDRFILGHWGRGLGKLFTFGGFGIWAVVDWFLIGNGTRIRNLQIADEIISAMRVKEAEYDAASLPAGEVDNERA